ncbi:putative vitamin H transporter [Microdochium trichocladiopsis]|uniref:Vitamin H transporter n=1 Tax=Microdochium trichocladiopsis TaxID=1682393 RepID=A0A9P9BJJ0_9PEZI|nr:putative vitamin H transporter [Microdochium trichocladiopsis]KAH7018198.1 putative vitamin H transporter [Microdochium trichocladiopsis]
MAKSDQYEHEHREEMDVESVKHREESLIAAYVPDTEEEKRLVRKIDLYLLPCIWCMYLMSYLDRTNIGNAKIAGMEKDLELTSDRYSIALVVFFIGYVLCEIPSNMILARTRPSRFLPTIMFIWGLVTMGMAWVPNYKALIGFRVVVGILEAGFAPGVILVISSWYKKSEQSKRFAVYISAAILSGAFGGLLAGAITAGMDGVHGLSGWRWLFLIEGVATSGVSVISAFVLLDFPATTSKFSPRERELAMQRLLADNVQNDNDEDAPKPTHLGALKMALLNWRVWLFVVGYMAIVGSSTLSYFYPTLVNGLGYTAHIAQYMTVPIYGAAFVVTLATGVVMDRYPQNRGLVLGGWLTFAMLCSVVICAVYNFTARYVLLVLMASALWAANGLAISYGSSTFGYMAPEVRAIALAFINAMGNLAQIYGSYLFPSSGAPKYLMGFGVISGLCFTGVVSYLTIHVVLRRWPIHK